MRNLFLFLAAFVLCAGPARAADPVYSMARGSGKINPDGRKWHQEFGTARGGDNWYLLKMSATATRATVHKRHEGGKTLVSDWVFDRVHSQAVVMRLLTYLLD